MSAWTAGLPARMPPPFPPPHAGEGFIQSLAYSLPRKRGRVGVGVGTEPGSPAAEIGNAQVMQRKSVPVGEDLGDPAAMTLAPIGLVA